MSRIVWEKRVVSVTEPGCRSISYRTRKRMDCCSFKA